MSRGIALLLLMAVIFALSTATYGEMYKSLDKAQCVARPGQRCIIPVMGRRGALRRCDCTAGFSCQYRPEDGRYACEADRFISDPDIRKIFF